MHSLRIDEYLKKTDFEIYFCRLSCMWVEEYATIFKKTIIHYLHQENRLFAYKQHSYRVLFALHLRDRRRCWQNLSECCFRTQWFFELFRYNSSRILDLKIYMHWSINSYIWYHKYWHTKCITYSLSHYFVGLRII